MALALLLLCATSFTLTVPPNTNGRLLPRQSPNPLHVRQDSQSPLLFCPASSWPETNLGSLVQPQVPDSELQSILSQVSPANIEATILKLVSFGTRHTLSSQTDPKRGIGAARDWIASEFRKYAEASEGRMTVDVPGYIQEPDGDRVLFPILLSDVVATLKGSEDPDRVYVVSGHYDTRCSDPLDYECDAPGADDE